MTDLETLIAGRERIARGWTQGTGARNAENMPVDPGSPEAVRWCAIAAIDSFIVTYTYLSQVLPVGFRFISEWNDCTERTQAEVLTLYDEAIELAREVDRLHLNQRRIP